MTDNRYAANPASKKMRLYPMKRWGEYPIRKK